jgi:hypothetical protein
MLRREATLFERVGETLSASWGQLTAPQATTAAVAPGAKPARDQRLDMFRGLALVMIFINHVPGNVFESWTSRNFGFSDAAEAFVLMSGMAAGLAYSSRFRTNALAATFKVFARARQLYFVHLTITLICLAIFAAAALWFAEPEVMQKNNIAPMFYNPLGVMIGLPIMGHQLGYLNILPLYITLLLGTPLFLWIGLKRPYVLLGASIVLWIVAGQFRFNLPNFPNRGGWFFNPFSWQLIFVVGLLSGAAMKLGKALVPANRVLFWVCTVFLVGILVWVKTPEIAKPAGAFLAWLGKLGVPFYISGFDKTFLALPRLLHALALAYVVSSLPFIRTFSDSAYSEPLKLLGRYGLPVFATGTVLSMLLQAIKTHLTPDPMLDGLLLASGLALQLGLAWSLAKVSELKTTRAAA